MRNTTLRRRLLTALAGVGLIAGIATPAAATDFTATLNGDAGGDTDGWGRVEIDVNGTLNRLCADVEVRSLGQVTDVFLMRGAASDAGAPVARFDTPDDEDSDDCDQIGDALADEIMTNPAGFFVVIKTADFPNGAIRGQLVPGRPPANGNG